MKQSPAIGVGCAENISYSKNLAGLVTSGLGGGNVKQFISIPFTERKVKPLRLRSRLNEDDLLDGGRKRMIDETGAFLTWALRHPDRVPGIPKRPVNAGGFDRLMRQPGARRAVSRWWDAFLDKVSD